MPTESLSMPLDSLFEAGSMLALGAWALLICAVVLPSVTARRWLLLAGGRVAPLALSMVYVWLLVAYWRSAPGGSFASLDGVAQLFASRGKLLGGWLHFLAFDLLVGRWMIDQTLKSAWPRWVLLPCLPLTFMYGPAGFMLFMLVRQVLMSRRKWSSEH